MKPSIYLIGVGTYTEVIIELARDCGYEVKGLYHSKADRVGEVVFGVKILASTDELFKKSLKGESFAVTVGNNLMRQNIAIKLRELGGFTPNLIHPTVMISKSAKTGVGCLIHFNACIWTNAKIGNDCVLSPNAMIAHHATMGNGCSVAPFSVVGAYSKIGNRVLFGINSVVLSKELSLGDDCLVGAKANVTKSYGANTTLVGNPARPI
ncbi:acetyltransferase [Algibacter mikhailovii]|uniref:PglD-related sugar-binding protein n=1 Tax=Algibacter mikhailovii TaxID=425498 RepID=UPI0024951F79|nr:acetyltransferase [Algibacter mikhailovii]